MLRSTLLTGLALLTLGGQMIAADDHGITYDTPEAAQADPDFAVQGEYVKDGQGIQVVALGDQKFLVVKHDKGLPGQSASTPLSSEERTLNELELLLAGFKKVNRASETLGKKPPAGAVVLFDGTEESLKKHWAEGARITEDGLLQEGVVSTDEFGDFSMHLEFRLPYMPAARGQARGNSGLYLQGLYEVQMLDSFGLKGEDNECGGIYKAAAPALNMCLPPLAWQTYDIDFTAAKFDSSGKKISDARATVKHNNVIIHDDVVIPQGTPGGTVSTETGEPGPLFLQNHSNPVRYRNIWVLPK